MELSVVLFVIAIFTTVGIGIYKKVNPRFASDAKKMAAIQKAIDVYFANHKTLPAGSNLFLDENNADFGKSYFVDRGGYLITASANERKHFDSYGKNTVWSAIVVGGVPVVDLGLPKEYAFDSYGNKIEYWYSSVLSSQCIMGNVSDKCQCWYNYSNKRSCKPIGYEFLSSASDGTKPYADPNDQVQHVSDALVALTFLTTDGSNTKHYFIPYNMRMFDANTDKEILSARDQLAYVLVSHGKEGVCSYSRKSADKADIKAIPSDKRKYNCANYWFKINGSTANYAFSQGSTYNLSSHKPITFYTGHSKSFDNLVYYKTIDKQIADASLITRFKDAT